MRIWLEYQSMSYMTLCLISIHISNINSKTSSHWYINEDMNQILPSYDHPHKGQGSEKLVNKGEADHEKIWNILLGTAQLHKTPGYWTLKGSSTTSQDFIPKHNADKPRDSSRSANTYETYTKKLNTQYACEKCKKLASHDSCRHLSKNTKHKIRSLSYAEERRRNTDRCSSQSHHSLQQLSTNDLVTTAFVPEVDCRPFVNHTQYDHLTGVAIRSQLAYYAEPEVAMIFSKTLRPSADESSTDSVSSKMELLQSKLQYNKERKSKSPHVYNQIGNFLRIHGNSWGAVECFRHALSISPNYSDVLLNLARILFNHDFLEDAIYLTRRSLESQLPHKNSWLQHFTLGEILKKAGHLREAEFHFAHSLELKPNFGPAQKNLRDLQQRHSPAVFTYYTIFIILFLVLMVICGLVTNLDIFPGLWDGTENNKMNRHFNRGMAMKTLKSLNCKPSKYKRSHSTPIFGNLQSSNNNSITNTTQLDTGKLDVADNDYCDEKPI